MSSTNQGDDFLFAEVARRVSAWLRQAYPGLNAVKLIAADLDVSPDTAKGWLAGQMPANRHMLKLKRRFGGAFVAFVYEPFEWSRDYDLRARLDDLRGRLDELRVAMDQREAGRRLRVAGRNAGKGC
jgi:hypothetical protein